MRKFSISKLSMDRNKRILGYICLLLIGIFLLYKFLGPKEELTWRNFPCNNYYPKQGILLINGQTYELPIFNNPDTNAQLCPKNLKTVNETLTVHTDTARTDWEIILADSMFYFWKFSNELVDVKSFEYRKERFSVPVDKVRDGGSSGVLIYKINLVKTKDTVLHFYYYNISQRNKPEAERHANYHLQIELKFKDNKNQN